MYLPIAIHHEPNTAYGVSIPDLPGAFSAGDTLAEAVSNAKEAIDLHIEGMLEDGDFDNIKFQSLEYWQKHADYAGAVWMLVEVDLSRYSHRQVRFNVSWPEYLLAEIDAVCAQRHETRSGFLAKAARAAVTQQV